MEFQFELLNADNYFTWVDDMKILLMLRGFWSFINGTEPPLDEKATRMEVKDYNLRKDRAYSTIYFGIERNFRALISETRDGKQAWDILKKHFIPCTRARIVQLLDEFFNLKYVPGESIGLYGAKLQKVVAQLKDCGHPLEEIYQCFQLIRYLPREYQDIIHIMYKWSDKEFVFDKVLNELIKEESILKLIKHDLSKLNVASNSSFGDKNIKPSDRKYETTHVKSNKISNKTGPCHKCKKFGHLMANCKLKRS